MDTFNSTLENERDAAPSSLTLADLNTDLDADPCVLDTLLGARLGMAQPLNIRSTIKAHKDELSLHGRVFTRPVKTSSKGGRPGRAYYLNEPQALLICMFANTPIAAQVRAQIISVFMEYRRSRQAPSSKTMCAMVLDGKSVFVDVDSYVLDGELAVVLKWDGDIVIEEAASVLSDDHKFAGERSALGAATRQGRGTMREGVVVLGRVVSATQKPKIGMGPQCRGRAAPFKDAIICLLGEGLSNREVARQTGATYGAVSYWRRVLADRAAA